MLHTEEATTKGMRRLQALRRVHTVSQEDTASPEDMVSRREDIKEVADTKEMSLSRTLADHHLLAREVQRILVSQSGHDTSYHSAIGSVCSG